MSFLYYIRDDTHFSFVEISFHFNFYHTRCLQFITSRHTVLLLLYSSVLYSEIYVSLCFYYSIYTVFFLFLNFAIIFYKYLYICCSLLIYDIVIFQFTYLSLVSFSLFSFQVYPFEFSVFELISLCIFLTSG